MRTISLNNTWSVTQDHGIIPVFLIGAVEKEDLAVDGRHQPV